PSPTPGAAGSSSNQSRRAVSPASGAPRGSSDAGRLRTSPISCAFWRGLLVPRSRRSPARARTGRGKRAAGSKERRGRLNEGMERMLRIGVAGGLASGKSSVAAILRGLGAVVFDADEIVKNLYEPGGAGANAARELFGDAVLDSSERIDRSRIAAIVFADP